MDFSKKLQVIKETIISNEIKVVSFDLFDTLVVRPCIQPTDLFKIVAKRIDFKGDFVNIRKMAEQYARRKKVYYHDDVLINEIYDEFAQLTNLEKDEIEKIMQCELDVEFDYVYPRYTIRELFNQVKNSGKKVIIVTDVYLPKTFIEKILEKNGLTGYYKLYVSSEERLAKGSGRLFQKVIAEFSREGIEKESIIHLGDNVRADVTMPKSMGMKAIHLPNTIGIFNSKNMLKPLYEFGQRTDSCYLVGTLANYLFDDPFFPFNIDCISGGDAKLFGVVLFGPILLSYTKWLIENSLDNNVDKLFFVMRDGYIIEKIYKLLSKAYECVPETEQIYLSRKIRYHFFGNEQNGLLNSFMQFGVPEKMTVNEFLEKRLLLRNEDKENVWKIFKEAGYPDIDSPMGKAIEYYHIMPELQKVFEKQVKEQIKIISEYCREKIQKVNNPAFIDVGYRGSVSRFLHDKLEIKNIGYQIMEIPLSRQFIGKEYTIKSFYSYTFKNVKDLVILHPLMEDIISKQEGTALKIDKVKNRFEVVKAEGISKNETLTQMQEGVLDYINYTFDILRKDFIDFRFDESLFFDLLFSVLRNPNNIDVNIIKRLSFVESDFIKINSDKNIYLQWADEKLKRNACLRAKENIGIHSMTSQPKVVESISLYSEEIQPWQKISKVHLLAIKVCEKLGILDFAIKVKKLILHNKIEKENNIKNVKKIFEDPVDEVIAKIKSMQSVVNDTKNKVLIAGHMVSFDKGTCNYLNKLAQHVDKYNLILMSECSHLNEDRVQEKIKFPFFIVPQFLGKDRYLTDTGIMCDDKTKKYVDKKEYLKWGVNNLIMRHADMEESYAYYLVYYAERFINRMLDVVNPEYVILWNQFFAFHHIFKYICNERNIKIIYFEFGSLPGTISIERLGQMGESFPGKFYKDFFDFPISSEELEKTREVLAFLKNSKLNRNIQPINGNILDIKKSLMKDRPTILYAGVNDYESGLVPYTDETAKCHSPIFKTSEEALISLQKYAKEHNCNLIYKPHPIIEKQMSKEKKFASNVILALDVDINDVIDVADVVVTILSQVSYTTLIREKPLVMLGYTQLRGKGCCYEAFKEFDIELVLDKAIKTGYSTEQKENFVRHIAQMNKYNLFDDLQSKPLQYGKSVKEAIEYIFECDDSSEWYLKRDKVDVYSSGNYL